MWLICLVLLLLSACGTPKVVMKNCEPVGVSPNDFIYECEEIK